MPTRVSNLVSIEAGMQTPSNDEGKDFLSGFVIESAYASVVFILVLASYLHAAASNGILWASPTDGGDADGYERLGYNLASGLGFGYCPSDEKIAAGEGEPIPTQRCQANCTAAEFELTAYRPPGFPLMVAAIYRLSPLNFFLVRLANCVCFALAVTIVSVAFAKQLSVGSGVAVALLCSIDPRMREFAGTFLTENLATLMMSLFAVTMVSFAHRKTSSAAVWFGLAFSGLVLVRSFYVAWYPVIWIVVASIVYLQSPSVDSLTQSRLMQDRLQRIFRSVLSGRFLCFALASLLLTVPWWVRNCLVLDSFMPTGTQGGIGIADGFSDSAYLNQGDWQPTTAGLIALRIRQETESNPLSRLAFEKEACLRGTAHAMNWISENPAKTLQLSWWKLCRLWECGSSAHTVLFLTAFIGLIATRDSRMASVVFLILVLNSLTVMATYHTYERFLTPLRPLIHGMVGCGVEWMALLIVPGLSVFHRRLNPVD